MGTRPRPPPDNSRRRGAVHPAAGRPDLVASAVHTDPGAPERDLQTVRGSAREREERLLSDQERLAEAAVPFGRLRVEHDSEMRRVKLESGAESSKYRKPPSGPTVSCRRCAPSASRWSVSRGRKTQLEELRRSSAVGEGPGALQGRVRRAAAQVGRTREGDPHRGCRPGRSASRRREGAHQLQAQEEINQRASRIAEQFEKEGAIALRQKEAELRSEIETKTAARFQEMTQSLENHAPRCRGARAHP